MSGYYIVVNKDNTTLPVHNLQTGVYFVRKGEAKYVIDRWSGRVVAQK